MPSTSDLKRGVRFLDEGVPYQVYDVTFQSPSARGGATLVKAKARDLLSGQLKSFVFKAGERLEDPDIDFKKVQYLYNDGENFNFMDVESFEQFTLDNEALAGTSDYLVEEMQIRLMFFNGRPVSIELPKAMDMVIAECEMGVKGDTVNNVTKQATTESGLQIQVPLFISVGDTVRVDTSEGRYVERVKVGK
jgi:elongation factor P